MLENVSNDITVLNEQNRLWMDKQFFFFFGQWGIVKLGLALDYYLSVKFRYLGFF